VDKLCDYRRNAVAVAVKAFLPSTIRVALAVVVIRPRPLHLPRLKPRTFYDLVVQVAIVSPAPSRATWSIPISDAGTRGRRRQDAGRAGISGICDEGRHGLRRLMSLRRRT
jgi:hypothetical protein